MDAEKIEHVAYWLLVASNDKSHCRCLSHGEGEYHTPACPVRLMREAAAIIDPELA